MLGTSHQLWRSELSPAPEREEDVVELAYILEPPMAAKIQWWRSATKTKSLYWSCWELNSKRKTKLSGALAHKRSACLYLSFFSRVSLKQRAESELPASPDFFREAARIWLFTKIIGLLKVNNFTEKFVFVKNYQQPVTNVKKILDLK